MLSWREGEKSSDEESFHELTPQEPKSIREAAEGAVQSLFDTVEELERGNKAAQRLLIKSLSETKKNVNKCNYIIKELIEIKENHQEIFDEQEAILAKCQENAKTLKKVADYMILATID